MDLNPDVYKAMLGVHWFARCGTAPPPELPFSTHQVRDAPAAIQSACGIDWRNAGTAAQGELTGYLAKHHYEAYGGHWNRLAQESRERIKKEFLPSVEAALDKMQAQELSEIVLLDLNRIALQSVYAKRFRRVPEFFQKLLLVYQHGHLPCGWIGDIDEWPEGELIIY